MGSRVLQFFFFFVSHTSLRGDRKTVLRVGRRRTVVGNEEQNFKTITCMYPYRVALLFSRFTQTLVNRHGQARTNVRICCGAVDVRTQARMYTLASRIGTIPGTGKAQLMANSYWQSGSGESAAKSGK